MTSVAKAVSSQAAYWRNLSPARKQEAVDRNRLRRQALRGDDAEQARLKAREADKRFRENNRDKRRKESRAAARKMKGQPESRARLMLAKVKTRAHRAGLDFDLTVEDLVIPLVCPVLGIPIDLNPTGGARAYRAPNSPSVDRIDSAKGYVKGNVAVISNRANLLKGPATIPELLSLIHI